MDVGIIGGVDNGVHNNCSRHAWISLHWLYGGRHLLWHLSLFLVSMTSNIFGLKHYEFMYNILILNLFIDSLLSRILYRVHQI